MLDEGFVGGLLHRKTNRKKQTTHIHTLSTSHIHKHIQKNDCRAVSAGFCRGGLIGIVLPGWLSKRYFCLGGLCPEGFVSGSFCREDQHGHSA